MITAMQAAKIETVAALYRAQHDVVFTVSKVCWNAEESRMLSDIALKIDEMIKRIIPK
jgi:hypothetical protein